MVLALLLTVLVWLAAVAVAIRLDLAGRAERIVASVLVWNGLVLLPIYVLGELGALRAWTLALAAAGLSLAALAAAGRAALRALPRALGEPFTLARDAALMVREHPVVGAVAVGGMMIEAWTLLMAFLAPAWRSFDALWYHEPIIGFAIQNHGLRWADIPFSTGQYVNTMSKACELTGLWFVIFAGRPLVDLANTLFHPPLVLAAFLAVRRMTGSRASAAGWALVVGLVPAFLGQLQSAYVDVQASALILAGLAFTTRPVLRRGDAGLAWLALALSVAGKLLNAIPAAILGLALLRRGQRRVAAAGIVLALGLAATSMVPNALHYGNPLYPVPIRIEPLGIDWQGLKGSGKRGFQPRTLGFIYRVPGIDAEWGGYWMPFYLPPHETQEFLPPYNYGYAVPWILLPLGVAGAAWTLRKRSAPWSMTLALGIAGVALVAVSAPGYARYQAFPLTALAMAAARFLDGRPRAGRWLVGAAAALSLVPLLAQDHPQLITPSVAWRMVRTPYPEREVTPDFGAPVERNEGLAREKELGPGSILVYGDDIPQPAPLWNNDFSNRIVYVPFADDFVKRAEALGATWIYAGETASSVRAQLRAARARWQYAGRLYVRTDWRLDGSVWRRKKP